MLQMVMENQHIPLTDENKEIIKTIENIIAPKASKGKAKAKSKPIDVDKPLVKNNSKTAKSKPIGVDKPVIKNNLKSPNPKQITLLPNQTLQIKMPEDYKACKIEFI